MTPALLVGAAVALLGAAILFGYQRVKKRRELFRQFAASNGWTWTQRDTSLVSRFQGSPFGQGSSRRAENVLQGSFRNRPMVAFDYTYTTQSGSGENQSTQTHRFAICALGLPAALPKLEVVPESVFGRLGTALGMRDLDLESEDFNRRFRVRAVDAKLAYDVLPPRTLEVLLTRPALHLRLAGRDAVCWESGHHSPADLLARLDTLSTVLDGVPAYVWTDLRGPTP